MNRLHSLRLILPIGILAVYLTVVVITLFFSLTEQRKSIQTQARHEILSMAGEFSREAELTLAHLPQLLETGIVNAATDKRVTAVAVTDPDDRILFSTRFSWRGKPLLKVVPHLTEEQLGMAKGGRVSHLMYEKAAQRLEAIMSFVAPAQAQELRSHDKGLIYIAMDLNAAFDDARRATIEEHIPELVILFVMSLLITMLVNQQVIKPLENLEQGAQAVAQGDFNQAVKGSDLTEIKGLTDTFNYMRQELADTVIKLDAQSQHNQAILDNVIDGIITIDQRGCIISFNQAAETIFGYRAQEVLGENVKLLMPEPYRSQHDHYIARYRETRKAHIIGIGREVEGMRKDGSLFPMELSVSEVSHGGEPFFIGMVRDVTERRRIEKMKSEFVSTVSHELRTPLTSISGSLGLLTGGAISGLPEQARSLLDIAYKNCQHLTLLINDLLDMEKIAAGKMHFDIKVQSLMPMIGEAVESNRGYADQHQVSIELTGCVDDLEIAVDEKRFIQVLSNYLSNAAKFSSEGDVVKVNVLAMNDCVRIEVSDNGCGIPESFHPQLFRKFSQADASDSRHKGGTGLGLAITRELAEKMGGHVGFESVEGKGSTFYVEFPIHKRELSGQTAMS